MFVSEKRFGIYTCTSLGDHRMTSCPLPSYPAPLRAIRLICAKKDIFDAVVTHGIPGIDK